MEQRRAVAEAAALVDKEKVRPEAVEPLKLLSRYPPIAVS
jgi:hypothetical protein